MTKQIRHDVVVVNQLSYETGHTTGVMQAAWRPSVTVA